MNVDGVVKVIEVGTKDIQGYDVGGEKESRIKQAVRKIRDGDGS